MEGEGKSGMESEVKGTMDYISQEISFIWIYSNKRNFPGYIIKCMFSNDNTL